MDVTSIYYIDIASEPAFTGIREESIAYRCTFVRRNYYNMADLSRYRRYNWFSLKVIIL